jgi:hypothetical protein
MLVSRSIVEAQERATLYGGACSTVARNDGTKVKVWKLIA